MRGWHPLCLQKSVTMRITTSDTSTAIRRRQPAWLTFVDKVADDGPWLRMMVNNPFNGAMCPLISEPVTADPTLDFTGARPSASAEPAPEDADSTAS